MVNRLAFPIPTELSAWAATESAKLENSGLFDSGNFILWCNPDEYQPVGLNIGEDRVIRGYGRNVVAIAEKTVGFQYDTECGRVAEFDFLIKLATLAGANRALYRAITVIDFCLVEPADLATGYTIRSMKFSSLITPKSGYYTGYSTGYSFQMMEIEPRYYY